MPGLPDRAAVEEHQIVRDPNAVLRVYQQAQLAVVDPRVEGRLGRRLGVEQQAEQGRVARVGDE